MGFNKLFFLKKKDNIMWFCGLIKNKKKKKKVVFFFFSF